MSSLKLVVVDSGIGNLRSVEKALVAAAGELGDARVAIQRSADPDVVRRADCLVVPGQGGFRDCARWLSTGMGDVLRERLKAGVPYLGICLGLQILFETSEEAPGAAGLGWFAGQVKRLLGGPTVKIPHMGWNQLTLAERPHPLLAKSVGASSWYYFIHSYHALPAERAIIDATVSHGAELVTAAVAKDNVFATQFHPEKSQAAGLALLRNFLEATLASSC